ncbi:SDR family NAD(P)-dependent oxidoreductase [Roseomonas hellenica]|uniref:SDR family NAD(P)-dependent oxidoreductase n=1 Tax=Plastoroseomonas hellenica TaxID=2687306 RepID=A0ABS5F3L8_9PROT|nr:SDR family NAD(P)-dependent oxidoreductase [Plastoroseomonas hellenica]MBR0667188.1 SDR family NAD(P)-dependent oxidoreductase [Plastoroseomonas hellenica]
MRQAETWVILGASSGVGRALAREVAARLSAKIILAGRDLHDLEDTATDLRIRHGVDAEVIGFDAAAPDTHAEFAARTTRRAEGLITVCFLSAIMPAQDAVEVQPTLAAEMVMVNLAGAMVVLLHLANALEKRRGGRVVVVGSVAGDRGRRKNFAYGASKAGLHAFTEGLAARLRPQGILVTLIKPGPLDTSMTWGLPESGLALDPRRAAGAILRATLRGRGTAYVPAIWGPIMTAIRMIPAAIFRRLRF